MVYDLIKQKDQKLTVLVVDAMERNLCDPLWQALNEANSVDSDGDHDEGDVICQRMGNWVALWEWLRRVQCSKDRFGGRRAETEGQFNDSKSKKRRKYYELRPTLRMARSTYMASWFPKSDRLRSWPHPSHKAIFRLSLSIIDATHH